MQVQVPSGEVGIDKSSFPLWHLSHLTHLYQLGFLMHRKQETKACLKAGQIFHVDAHPSLSGSLCLLRSEEADSKKDHSNRSSTVPLVLPFLSALCGTAGVPPKMGYSGVESGDLPIFFNKKSASPDPTKDR